MMSVLNHFVLEVQARTNRFQYDCDEGTSTFMRIFLYLVFTKQYFFFLDPKAYQYIYDSRLNVISGAKPDSPIVLDSGTETFFTPINISKSLAILYDDLQTKGGLV